MIVSRASMLDLYSISLDHSSDHTVPIQPFPLIDFVRWGDISS